MKYSWTVLNHCAAGSVYCKSGNILEIANFAREAYLRIQESRKFVNYNNANKENFKHFNTPKLSDLQYIRFQENSRLKKILPHFVTIILLKAQLIVKLFNFSQIILFFIHLKLQMNEKYSQTIQQYKV